MLNRLPIRFIVILLLSALLGCADHLFPVVTPGTARLRVKALTQVVTSQLSLSTVSAFSYDEQNRLRSLVAYQLPDSSVAPVEQTRYEYDAQGRLSQVQHAMVRRGSLTETYTFTYNQAGQLAQLVNLPSTFRVSLQYNAANLLTGFGKGIGVSGLQSTGGGSLTFTGPNLTNASETLSVFRSGGSPTAPAVYSRSTSTTYAFDDKTNPFYGAFLIPAPGVFLPFASSSPAFGPFYTFYGGIDNVFNLSQNNVVSAEMASATTTYSYSYNGTNLPIRRTTTTPAGITEILHYEYEAY
ncbi:hypothetical protein [Spirosoma aerophilum]